MSESATITVCSACNAGEVIDGVCRGCGWVAETKSGPELLTSSRLRAYRTCARLHHYLYVEGWRPAREPEYFRVGTLVHLGLEAWWAAAAAPETDDPSEALRKALEAVNGRAADEFEAVRVEEMLRGYDMAWFTVSDQYEVLGLETSFDCALINPETWKPSRTWRLAGKVDGIVRRKSNGRVLVLEHKTSSEDIEGDDANYWSKLAIDHQCSAYVLGAESLGHRVDEILYDVVRKPGQKPLKATPPESRKYTKDGRLYAAQREFDETPEEYRARIREKIEADLPRFYRRMSVVRTESQVRDFLVDAWQQARAMRESEKLGYAPKNPEACHRFGTCSYWSMCSTGTHPAEYPAEFVKVADVHPELGR